MQSRKEDIIIQLGSENLRIGLISDRTPRKTLPSSHLSWYNPNIPKYQYDIKIEQLLYSLFYTHLNSSFLNRTVILLEKVYTDRRIIQSVVQILFKKFKVDRVQFALSCVTPLYLSGRVSGVVVAGGAAMVEVMPVFDSMLLGIVGFPLMQIFKSIPLGTSQIHTQIKNQLFLLNPQSKSQLQQRLTPQFLSDIKILYSNMNLVQQKSQQTINLTLKRIKLKLKPSSLTYGYLFGNVENQEYNIVDTLLTVLQKVMDQCGISVWENLVANVVLAGGLWRVKGMQMYFKRRLGERVKEYPKQDKCGIRDKIRFVSWGFNPAEVSWIGASVGASIKAVECLCLKKSEYESDGFTEKIMQNYFLSN